MEADRKQAWLALIVAILAVSCSSILIRLTVTPPLVTALYRQLFCAVLVLPFARREPFPNLSRKDWMLLILSGLFLALHFAFWTSSLFQTTVAHATLFVDLQPVWAAILGAIFLQENLLVVEIAGVAIVTLGGILTVAGTWEGLNAGVIGDLLALAGGLAGAAYLLIGRKTRKMIPWVQYMFSVYSFSTLWLFLFGLVVVRRVPLPADRDIFWIFLMAVFPGIMGHGLINFAVREIKVYAVNAALLGEPVLATIAAYFLFREMPDPYYFAGALLIFVGLLIIFLSETRKDRKEMQPQRLEESKNH